jgi:type VI protein secretion system component Hcp
MKKQLAARIAFLLLIGTHTMAQKILLKIGSITATGGEEVRAVDFKIDAATSWSLGGGASVGVPKVHEFLVKKTSNISSNDIYKKILQGASFPEVVLEYYNISDRLYFKITLKDVYISNFYFLSPECPTCLELEQQVAFVPKQIETFDVATGVTIGYDVPERKVY